jgi:hypothetical protein
LSFLFCVHSWESDPSHQFPALGPKLRRIVLSSKVLAVREHPGVR